MATSRSGLVGILSNGVVGLAAGFFIFVGTLLVTALLRGVLEAIATPTRFVIILAILAVVAFCQSVALGAWRGKGGERLALIGGVVAATLLFLFRLGIAPGDSFNPLVFGWPGMMASVVLCTVGGWLGARLSLGRPSRSSEGVSYVQLAAFSVIGWVVVEVVSRILGGITLAGIVGNSVAGDMLVTLFVFPLLAWGIARYGRGKGIASSDCEYRWHPSRVIVGIVGGVVIMALLYVTAPLDQMVSPPSEAATALTEQTQAGGWWVAALLLLVNGFVVPIAEELAWRGVIQTALVRAWGMLWGVGVTAVAFAYKHVVVDFSISRIVTLLMFALVVGIVRARWGTGSSTLTHVTANTVATTLALVAS